MQIRYSRNGTVYDAASSIAIDSALLGDPTRFVSFAAFDASFQPVPFTLTDHVSGDSETFDFLDPTQDAFFIDFSDSTASVAVTGGRLADTIVTGSGNDYVFGWGGADRIYTGAGDDQIAVKGNYSFVDGGDGFDTLGIIANTGVRFANGNLVNVERILIDNGGKAWFDALTGGVGEFRSLSVAGGGVIVSGTQVDDLIYAGRGADTLYGNGGDDRFVVTALPASVDGGVGYDTLMLRGGIDYLLTDSHVTGIEQISLVGGSLDLSNATHAVDRVVGAGKAGVAIIGTAFGDTILGGAGDDVLVGGGGGDDLAGRGGADVFAFRSLSDFGTATLDRITDFSHADGDLISLSGIGDMPFHFIDNAAFSRGDAPELRIEQRGLVKWIIQGDVDHDGHADFSFIVRSVDGPIEASDFVF